MMFVRYEISTYISSSDSSSDKSALAKRINFTLFSSIFMSSLAFNCNSVAGSVPEKNIASRQKIILDLIKSCLFSLIYI